jgi:hypothetical protein
MSDRSRLVKWRSADDNRWVDMRLLGDPTPRWIATYREAVIDGDDSKPCWNVMYSQHNMVPKEELLPEMSEEDVRDYIYIKCILMGALNEN